MNMTSNFAAAMRRAALSTRALDMAAATRVIQDALAGRSDASRATPVDITPPQRGKQGPSPDRLRRPLGEVLKTLREGRLMGGASGSLPGINLPGMKRAAPPPMADGARFLTRSFTCAAGARSYRLYIPASATENRARGLVLMLHGCKQDPDDFAAGANMNAVAEAHGLVVAYPGQPGTANASSCWNWFNPGDQMRDAGEPSIIAGITRELMAEYGIDRDRTFVAGLSAGGAMAAVMGVTYPDLFAAIGVHSGLAYGSANDVMSAFSAMRGSPNVSPRARPRAAGGRPRTIVFQGSADQTVHPSNAERIAAAADLRGAGIRESGSAGGRAYTRTVLTGADAIPAVEVWLIDGAGHAWSGGHPGGSYTDPQGPDASAEMVRFFLAGQGADGPSPTP